MTNPASAPAGTLPVMRAPRRSQEHAHICRAAPAAPSRRHVVSGMCGRAWHVITPCPLLRRKSSRFKFKLIDRQGWLSSSGSARWMCDAVVSQCCSVSPPVTPYLCQPTRVTVLALPESVNRMYRHRASQGGTSLIGLRVVNGRPFRHGKPFHFWC